MQPNGFEDGPALSPQEPQSYGYAVEVIEGYDEAVIRSRLALRREGFSIITEMHVGDLLVPEPSDQRQYLIMGAWSSGVTKSPADDIEIAVHLSCNVVVHEQEGGAVVAALDPVEDVDPSDEAALAAAHTARDALARALQSISSGPGELSDG
ncbi:MAG: hypothetical protein QOF16_576 [Actinomycetota bacterium]|jgi:uncharacterized protein (DUF302 family)|nr:hypothetical protein [Actinomycetota bacterium]